MYILKSCNAPRVVSSHLLQSVHFSGNNLFFNPMFLTIKCSAVCEQAVSVIPEVDVCLGIVWRNWMCATSVWLLWCTQQGMVPVARCISDGIAFILSSAQFRVTKSPDHSTEIDKKCAHYHHHECIRLHHCFGE